LPLHRRYSLKFHILVILASLITLLSLNEKSEGLEKKFNVGIGTYALKVAYDDPYALDDDLSGIGISLSYAVSDQFALRGEY